MSARNWTAFSLMRYLFNCEWSSKMAYGIKSSNALQLNYLFSHRVITTHFGYWNLFAISWKLNYLFNTSQKTSWIQISLIVLGFKSFEVLITSWGQTHTHCWKCCKLLHWSLSITVNSSKACTTKIPQKRMVIWANSLIIISYCTRTVCINVDNKAKLLTKNY